MRMSKSTGIVVDHSEGEWVTYIRLLPDLSNLVQREFGTGIIADYNEQGSLVGLEIIGAAVMQWIPFQLTKDEQECIGKA